MPGKEMTMDTSQGSDSPAVEIARANLEAWTNHDFEKARSDLAEEVQSSRLFPSA
jgi:hypothetical protein